MKRLLIPLDGSPLAETILPVAEEWAKEEDAEVVLLRAFLARPSLGADDNELEVGAVGEGETYLKGLAERLERRGVKRAHWGVWHEEPAAAIVLAGAEYGVDMIAMATHGRSGLSRLVLGSVAEAVIRAVRVPVLLMRGQSAWKPWASGKVLVPLDGSESAEAILPVVERLAGPRDLTIVLFKAVEPLASAALSEAPIRPDQLMALRRGDAERYLAKVAEALWGKGLRAECAVKFGKPAETIATFAGREQADFIAMATHGRSGLGRLLLGSVAAGVLRGASVPVLLLKAGERVR
jgi:nucleotide-binding universal stress UspA family protein